MKFLKIIRFPIGLAIIGILIFKVGIYSLFETLSSIDISVSLWFIPVYALTFITATFNYKLLLGISKTQIMFSKLLRYFLTSWSLGYISPGKVGEFSLALMLTKEGVPLGRGLAICFIDKLITLIVSIVASIFCGFVFFPDYIGTTLLLSSIMLLAVCVTVFWSTGRSFIKKYLLGKYEVYFEGFYSSISNIARNEKKVLLANLLLTILKITFQAGVIYIFFVAFGHTVNILYVIMITALLQIITLIPITISGLGVREVSAVALFSKIGVNPVATLNVYLIAISVAYILSALFLFMFLKNDMVEIPTLEKSN